MPVIYVPTKSCPKCPLNELCDEEERCPILRRTSKPLDIGEVLRQFAKLQTPKDTRRIERSLEASSGDRNG